MNRNLFHSLAIVSTLIISSTLCQADTITTFTSQSAFSAALAPDALTDTFSNFGGEKFIYTHSDSNATFAYTASAPNAPTPQSHALAGFSTTNPPLLTTENSNQPILFTMTQGDVTAVGGYFYDVNIGLAFESDPVSLAIHYGNGLTDNVEFTPTSLNGSYFGITDTDITTNGFITSVTVNAPKAFGFAAISDFTVGTAAAVPEPAALLLTVIAAACILASKAYRIRGALAESSTEPSNIQEAIERSRMTRARERTGDALTTRGSV
jgi:hypothetical protein